MSKLVDTLLETPAGVVIAPGMRIKNRTRMVPSRDAMGRTTGPDVPFTIYVASASSRFVMVGSHYRKSRWATSDVIKNYTSMDGQPLVAPPEKAVKVPKNPAGTCPCCFAIQQTKGGAKAPMVDHGYQVPNWGQGGWRQGSCPGVGYPAFQISPEGTQHYLAGVQSFIAGCERAIDDLKSGRVKDLPDPNDHSMRRDARGNRIAKIRITAGGYLKPEEEPEYWRNQPADARQRHYDYAWKEAVDNAVREQEFHLKGATVTANQLKHYIATWKKAPLLHPITKTPLPEE